MLSSIALQCISTSECFPIEPTADWLTETLKEQKSRVGVKGSKEELCWVVWFVPPHPLSKTSQTFVLCSLTLWVLVGLEQFQPIAGAQRTGAAMLSFYFQCFLPTGPKVVLLYCCSLWLLNLYTQFFLASHNQSCSLLALQACNRCFLVLLAWNASKPLIEFVFLCPHPCKIVLSICL